MKRIYHPYHKWEEFHLGMWRKESKTYESENLPLIIEFTGNHIEYGKAMIRVINEWKFSCENTLTNESINRKAWIGHAACCIQYGWPEYLVRVAWGKLTERQQLLANNEAEKAIKLWELNHKSQTTLNYGKTDAMQTEYQMKLRLN